MDTTPVRPSTESSERPGSSRQRRRNDATVGHAELKRLIACSEQRKIFVRCAQGSRESKLARILEKTPSLARIPKDLYAGADPAGEIQNWRGSLLPHNTRNKDLEELMTYGFDEDGYYGRNPNTRGSRRQESSSPSPWTAHREILQDQCEEAEQRSQQRMQQTLNRYARVEELPTFNKTIIPNEKRQRRGKKRFSVDASNQPQHYSSGTRRSGSASRPPSAVTFAGNTSGDHGDVLNRSSQAVQEMKEAGSSLQKSKILLSKQLQQDLGRFVYEFPRRYAAKYKAFSGPSGLNPDEALETMRLEHEYDTLKRQLSSQEIFEKVVRAVPNGKDELSCVDRVFLHVVRLALHKCIVLSPTNVFLLLDRVHFEIMTLSKRDNLFHKLTHDNAVFENYLPDSSEFNSSYGTTASALGLRVESEMDDQESIFSHLSDEDVKQLLGHISQEDAPYWPVALKKPIKVLLNSLDVSPDRYLEWLKWKKLKIPLDDRVQSSQSDYEETENEQ